MEVTAIAYDGDVELSRTVLETTGAAAEILLEADVEQQDLIYVDISLRDEQGRAVLNRDTALRVHVTGGELIGLGSANPRFIHRAKKEETETFLGRAQAILRKTGKAAAICVETETGLRSFLKL